MNIRFQKLISTLLAGGLVAAIGCARNSPARVQLVSAEQAPAKKNAAEPSSAAARSGRFAFPSDQGGPLLRELLGSPSRLPDDSEVRLAPRPQPVPKELAHPELPTSSGQAELPRSAHIRGTRLRPMSPAEAAPLADYRMDPSPTSRPEMRGGSPIRLPSRDVNLPTRLPILGVLTVDRVPLEDPTTEESVKAALAAVPPIRTNPAPFSPRNLPDPFENTETGKLRTSLPEDPQPISGPLRAPVP